LSLSILDKYLDKYHDKAYNKATSEKGVVTTMPTLRQIRESHFISRKELAQLAHVSESTIVRIEDPQHRTTQDVVEKVLEALSGRIGEALTLESVDGLNIYNVMRDRRQRTKDVKSDEAA